MNIPRIELTPAQANIVLNVEEGHFVDIKRIDLQPAKLTQAASAFANTSGGELYIGIGEQIGAEGPERIWEGFDDQEEANGMLQALEAMSALGNHYGANFLAAPGCPGLVLLLTIHKSREILRASNGKAYVRRGAQKLPVEGEEALQRLKYDKGLGTFEEELVRVEKEAITESQTALNFLQSIVPNAQPEVWLEKQRVLYKGVPTVAGVLLFNDEPQSILPKRSAIKVFRYKTKAEGERDYLAGDPVTVEGPVYELIYSAVDRIKTIIESIEKLGLKGFEKVTYPPEAVHEIITNAVLHRDYSIIADIQVRIFDNRIEIESPGRFAGHVTTRNYLNEQFARNPKLVRLINKFPNPPNKDVGEGLNTAFEAMEKLRLKPPVVDERENSVVVILKHESLGSPEQLVMQYLETHEEITNLIGREITGIKSENSMKEVFYRLRDRQMLEQVPGKLGNKAAWRKRGSAKAADVTLF